MDNLKSLNIIFDKEDVKVNIEGTITQNDAIIAISLLTDIVLNESSSEEELLKVTGSINSIVDFNLKMKLKKIQELKNSNHLRVIK